MGGGLKMKKLRCVFLALTVVTLGVSFLSCSKTDGNKSAKADGNLVALQINDQKIDAAVLENFLEKHSLPMNGENADELLKKKVDELVVEELLYQEALRLKLDQAPDTRQRVREIMNQKLFEEQIRNKVKQLTISQPELQTYYDAHLAEFNRPEEVRVADLFIAVPKDATDDQRTELKKKAEAALAEALATENQRAGFLRLIRKYSDQPEKYAKGDTGFFSAEGKPGEIDPKIVEAAFKLEKNGDISPAVIEASDGYHIIMQNGKRPAFNKPLEQVARYLERRIKNDELQKKREELIQELRAKAKIVMDEKMLAQIREKLKTANKTRPIAPGIQNLLPSPLNRNKMPPIMGDNAPPQVAPGDSSPPKPEAPADEAPPGGQNK
jgi:peptidyl-prolyl cis-trans isomerase C